MFETVGAPCLCVVALRNDCTGIIMIEFLFVLNFAFLSFDIVWRKLHFVSGFDIRISACPGAMCFKQAASPVNQVWARDLFSARKNTNHGTKELTRTSRNQKRFDAGSWILDTG